METGANRHIIEEIRIWLAAIASGTTANQKRLEPLNPGWMFKTLFFHFQKMIKRIGMFCLQFAIPL